MQEHTSEEYRVILFSDMVEELKAERYQEVGRCYTLHESHTSVHLIRLSAFRVGENGEYVPTVSGTVVCHIYRNRHIEDDRRRWGLAKGVPHIMVHIWHCLKIQTRTTYSGYVALIRGNSNLRVTHSAQR